MKNELLLIKSNLRKRKGTSIGISLLIFIASLLVSLCLLLFLDAYPNSERYAKKLNSGDGYVVAFNDTTGLTDSYIESIIKDDVESYDKLDGLFYTAKSVKYSNGELSTGILVANSTAFSSKLNKTEIVVEDNQYSSNYVYLPYQFYTAGGYHIGDEFIFPIKDRNFNYTVRGFINNTDFGCTNSGPIQLIVDDINYQDMKNYSDISNVAIIITFQTKDEISPRKLGMKLNSKITSFNNKTISSFGDLDSIVANRGFMSLILAVSFLTITLILAMIIVLMVSNCISNYIKENMKEIGALKAIGYTSKNIISSIILQFAILAVISSIIGTVIAYSIMPVVSNIVNAQTGLPYNVHFNFIASFLPFILIVLFVGMVVLLSTRKIKKIEPIVALKEGVETHNFKKNRVPLDKSKISLNASLSFKTLFTNLKQNVITFVITGFLTFVSVVSLLMFENFNVNPMVEILTFETFSGLVTVDKSVAADTYDYLSVREDTENVRKMINYFFIYGDNDDEVVAYIIDDPMKLNNKNVVYEGKLPKYDNEIAVSGKFAQIYNYSIGDTIEFGVSDKKASYLITGYLQTCNNGGREALLSEKAAEQLVDITNSDGYFWFDCDKEKVNTIINDCKTKYGDKFVSSLNFYEVLDGSIGTFKSISALMLIVTSGISVCIILLVLYLLIKSLLHNKRKEYGVLKALGYRNKDLMTQTALSFMPSIILSSIVSSILSYFLANKFMNLIMINFGLVKCSFVIPVVGVVIIGIALCVISFLFALLESKKIKNIEPYNLLIAE